MRFVLPLLLALIGAASGVGAGLYLRPGTKGASADIAGVVAPSASEGAGNAAGVEHGNSGSDGTYAGAADSDSSDEMHQASTGGSEFTKLNNQFVVPVLREGRVKSMVVLSLSLETPAGKREEIYALEPRIRDTFLQVLFDHANAGGFDGEFTNGENMDLLRGELRRSGRMLLGKDVVDVLVTDIARQDLG